MILKPDPAKQKMQALEMEGRKAEVEKTQSEGLLNEAKAAESMGKIVGMLQQVLAGVGALQMAIPGGPEPTAVGGPPAMAGAGGGQMIDPQGAGGPMPPVAQPLPMVPNA